MSSLIAIGFFIVVQEAGKLLAGPLLHAFALVFVFYVIKRAIGVKLKPLILQQIDITIDRFSHFRDIKEPAVTFAIKAPLTIENNGTFPAKNIEMITVVTAKNAAHIAKKTLIPQTLHAQSCYTLDYQEEITIKRADLQNITGFDIRFYLVPQNGRILSFDLGFTQPRIDSLGFSGIKNSRNNGRILSFLIKRTSLFAPGIRTLAIRFFGLDPDLVHALAKPGQNQSHPPARTVVKNSKQTTNLSNTNGALHAGTSARAGANTNHRLDSLRKRYKL